MDDGNFADGEEDLSDSEGPRMPNRDDIDIMRELQDALDQKLLR